MQDPFFIVAYLRKVDLQNETYRLFGVSSFSTKKKNLACLRFDTCYQGCYFEIFYVFVRLQMKDKIFPRIAAHTLPSFLPIAEWEKEYLSTDIQVTFVARCDVDIHTVCFASSEQLRGS